MNVEIDITRMNLEGQGVGYDSEKNIYFVPGAITGDRVEVVPEQTAKRYRDSRLERVVTPSPDRVESPCAHFQVCGGCDWLQWEYSAQLTAKENILRHVLERGGLAPREFFPMLPSPSQFGYRHRIQVRQMGATVGFFKRASHEIVDIKDCRVAHPKLNEAIAKLRATPSAAPLKAELFVDDRGEVGHLYDVAHGAGGFTQINAGQNERLRTVVANAVKANDAQHVVELFCGNGNLSFAFFPLVSTCYAVDASRAAITRAREMASELGLTKLFFAHGNVEAMAAKMPQDVRDRCDTLVLDPPRTGMASSLEPFVHDGVKTIVYVSCSPVAFTKDVQCLKKAFTLRSVQPIDMFPHTRHIEFVAVFSRS
jgi:23S rRNA (uracil1939-C5)-methyltransferase